ncbi:oxygenase MpaB family protein [Actinomadura vinacea]|uniref:Oxygenase MpaB family protein n=1 Tax=Actinomadura vinacea TaxID=115336 RepID=A0ABN3ITR0_9ACTN
MAFRRLFEQALQNGIESLDAPPRELVDLFAEVDAVPYWVDPDLVRTGDLDTMAPRRLAKTASWWVDVTTPGGLGRFEAGFRSTLRVRVMHAQVRAAIHERDDWDFDAWDAPINQIQLTGTLLLFSLVMLLGSRTLGLRFSAADRAAALHLWRYAGHLMGVHPDLLPATEADAWRLLWLEADTEFMPDQDSQRLARSLMNAAAPLLLPPRWKNSALARRALTNYLLSYSRLILGKRNADFLGAPDDKRYQAAVAAASAAVFVLETARRLVPGATRLSEHFGHHHRTTMVRRMIREQRGDLTHSRHDSLRRAAPPAPDPR